MSGDANQTPAPQVSVVIPVLNGEFTIGDQLLALAGQQKAPSFEVVIADNGSTDATAQVVRGFIERFPSWRLVDASTRRGASHARNVGLRAACGEIVAFCDADDVVASDWVAEFAQAVREGVMASGWIDMTVLNPPYTYGGSGVETELAPISGYLPSIGSGNVAIARRDALAIGGFDESFRFAVEDIDFGWRAQQHGIKLIKAPARLYCRLRADNRSVFRQSRTWGRGNIMLRLRHRQHVPNAMSFRYSVTALINQIVRLPAAWPRADVAGRRLLAQRFGTTLGEFEGHVIFRVIGRVPAPELLEGR